MATRGALSAALTAGEAGSCNSTGEGESAPPGLGNDSDGSRQYHSKSLQSVVDLLQQEREELTLALQSAKTGTKQAKPGE